MLYHSAINGQRETFELLHCLCELCELCSSCRPANQPSNKHIVIHDIELCCYITCGDTKQNTKVNQTHTTTAIENQQTVLVDQIVLQTHIILLATQDTKIVVQMTIQIIVSKEYSPVTHIVKASKL